jgi:integrase
MGAELIARRDPLQVIDRVPHLAESTKAKYKRALDCYLETGDCLTDADALARHAATLPGSGQAFLKAALRLLTDEMAVALKGQARPENLDQVQAALLRIEALQGAVRTSTPRGTKAHIWLSLREVKALFDTCSGGIVGQRDRLVLGLLVAAGLRREEAASLRFEDVGRQSLGDKERTVLAIKGKGARNRAVPIADRLADAIDEWASVVGGEGHIARALGMNRDPGKRISAQGIFRIVRKRGAMIGRADLAPHDLRRTYAQLGYEVGIPVTQISRLLGHANLTTTQRYLSLDLDLETTISDFIPF